MNGKTAALLDLATWVITAALFFYYGHVEIGAVYALIGAVVLCGVGRSMYWSYQMNKHYESMGSDDSPQFDPQRVHEMFRAYQVEAIQRMLTLVGVRQSQSVDPNTVAQKLFEMKLIDMPLDHYLKMVTTLLPVLIENEEIVDGKVAENLDHVCTSLMEDLQSPERSVEFDEDLIQAVIDDVADQLQSNQPQELVA